MQPFLNDIYYGLFVLTLYILIKGLLDGKK
jgi:hypothetical protein